MKKIFLILTSLFLILFSCKKETYEYAFQDPSLSPEERAADLVSRLTLEEKVLQMLNDAPAIERLGIPSYNWWNECLHGIGRTEYKVTVFPQAIGMAAGWDTDAMKMMADYTSEEGRAIYNLSSAQGNRSIYHGLTYWTPNVNIFRDPRWGRGQETYGEDPYLTGELGSSFVYGLQGNDPVYLKAAACAKHYAVHSGPEHNRHEFNVDVSQYDLWDTYLPAFYDLVVNAEVAGVMCAYNAFEGKPCCGSDVLMMDILRNQWGFNGYVTSDCGAIDDFYRHHKTHPDAASAAADAVFHGTDIDCGNEAYKALVQAVENGLITEEQIDVSVKRLFTIRFRLGLFNPADKDPYSDIDATALEKDSHKAHALKMARQSVVLLKNENNILPLSKNIKKIAVLGPNADDTEVLLGNYNGFPTKITTVLDGIREKAGDEIEVYYDSLVGYTGNTRPNPAVIEKAKEADVILFCGGISPNLEGEEMPHVDAEGFYKGDRTTIALPAIQTETLKALKATGKPVIFVLMSGSAVGIEWEAANLPAILSAWYGGQSAGTAIADILFGDYNPSGRLPVTFYASDKDLPDFEDYSMENRTYRYFKGKPLYPFGYGLSYTSFGYEWKTPPVKSSYQENEEIRCIVKIKNTGAVAGDEVVQVYIKYPQGKERLPLKELRAFTRINLQPQKEAEWTISVPVRKLKKWNEEKGAFTVPSGEYILYIGGNSQQEAVAATFTIE
ncbi:MAG: glycoside hydrolase family 3 C-terminal domain-containing protein [Candidatus Azobacteroides sp.]|nr:glycoside hydrolase family 3 C-terminal domain-containing protein [Candidatus Azobacteroides sp.]